MKKFLKVLVGSLFFMGVAFAQDSYRATIDDIVCDRLEAPIYDVCIVFTTDTDNGSEIALVFDRSQFERTNSTYRRWIGRTANIFDTYLSQITNADAIRVLKSFEPAYFYLESIGNGQEIRIIKKP